MAIILTCVDHAAAQWIIGPFPLACAVEDVSKEEVCGLLAPDLFFLFL